MIKTEIGVMEIGLILFSGALEVMETGLIELGLQLHLARKILPCSQNFQRIRVVFRIYVDIWT